MSGPVTSADAPPVGEGSHQGPPMVDVTASRITRVGELTVRRALPRRGRRTVGAWCFLDHMGPVAASDEQNVDIGPHPHMGLQTVTWLLAGEFLHRDSLGSEQLIRPGQLNLMTAGHGVVHAEEKPASYHGDLHGVQLWVAQPESTRHGSPAFEHHAELPVLEVEHGTATVLVGDLGGAASPARRDTDHVGAELDLRRGASVVPMQAGAEYALVVLSGELSVEGTPIEPGHLAYLGAGRDECSFSTVDGARALLLGGSPFDDPILMWWNFVGRTREEVGQARDQWTEDDGRFGRVDSLLPRIPVGPPPWS